nr:hypothetical protein [Tanacetum cinerariifolium]
STAKVKTVNDEVRVQALIDGKRINIKESSIRCTLKLDDEQGISCLANDDIFTGLANMGYEKMSDMLTFYKAFFSPHWKFLIHTILQCLSAKTTSWNEFSSTIASLGDMSHHQDIYDNPSLTKKVFSNMKRVGTSFSRVITPFFKNMLVPAAEEVGQAKDDVSIPTKPSTSKPHKKHKSKKQQPIAHKVPSPAPSPEHQLHSPSNDPIPDANKDSLKFQELMDLCTTVSNKEENRILKGKSFKSAKIDTAAPVKDKEESVKQGRMITDMDEDVKVNLQEAQAKAYNLDLQHSKKVLSMQEIDEEEPAKVEEVLELVTVVKLMTEVVTTAAPTTTAAQVPKVSAPRRRRGVVIQNPEETATLVIVHTERKPLTEAQARKNMMIYLKNIAAFKMNFFKGMTYSKIRPLFEKHYNSIKAFLEKEEEEVTVQEKEIEEEGNKRQGESIKQDITKNQRMDEEVKELKRHLQIVGNDDDDVYTEATLLTSK